MAQDDLTRLKDGNNVVNRWWHMVRPYWHVGSFLVLITFIVTLNWSKVLQYDSRIVALELWRIESSAQQAKQSQDIAIKQAQQGQDIAVVKPDGTLGTWLNPDGSELCKTIELPWLNNHPQTSSSRRCW